MKGVAGISTNQVYSFRGCGSCAPLVSGVARTRRRCRGGRRPAQSGDECLQASRPGSASSVRRVGNCRCAHLPVEATPSCVPFIVGAPTLWWEWRLCAHADDADPVGALVAEGQARRQPAALCPAEVRDETRGFPRALHHAFVPCATITSPEEGEPPVMEVQAHQAVEPAPRRHRRQGLDVGALDLPRCLPHLALADHGARVGAERDAAAAAGLEVHDGHAEVVGVRQNFGLQVHAVGRGLVEDVGAQAATKVGDLVRMRY
mmetsp:Transcript_102340/g.289835  ORF Transcript_102340/g.289835 Transcript_102340/m.289835 type:complete len:261 (+) Transcript_102340:161-943(+)